jgi:uncharacterized membrane protein
MNTRINHLIPAAFIASITVAAGAQSFTPTGDLPGGTYYSQAGYVSADGVFASGFSDVGAGQRGFRWNKATGSVELSGLPANVTDARAYGISGNGSALIGFMEQGPNTGASFTWTPAGGVTLLPAWTNHPSVFALDMSYDGTAIAGTTGNASGESHPFRLVNGAYTEIPNLAGSLYGVGYGLSGNGTTVVGYSSVGTDHRAIRWSQAGGTVYLGDLPGGLNWSEATNTSYDGRTIVGGSYAAGGEEPFVWTAASGMVSLGNFASPVPNGSASACSGDGSVVVGHSRAGNDYTAFIWDAAHGMRTLAAALSSAGAPVPHGWTLTYAYAISHDGNTVVGVGINPQGNTEGFVAQFRKPCPGDLNQDGLINTADLTIFLGNFGKATVPLLGGDLNGSGSVNTADLTQFLGLFGSAC